MATVSVIMPVYNETEDMLRQSITSVLNQTYKDLELIIVYDNPDDIDLYNLLVKVCGDNPRIRLFRNDVNIGAAESRNRGVAQAIGEYIAILDADDIAFQERLQIQADYLEKGYDFVAGNVVNIGMDGKELRHFPPRYYSEKSLVRLLRISNCIMHSTVMVRKDLMLELGSYRRFETSEDYDFFLRLASSGARLLMLPEALIYYRVRQSGLTYKTRLGMYWSVKYAQKLYKERIRSGKDSFTEERLTDYLRKHRCFDEIYKQRFVSGFLLLRESYHLMKRKRFIKALIQLFMAIRQNPLLLKISVETLHKLLVQRIVTKIV